MKERAVSTIGSDSVNRDKIVHGDDVHGDKVGGDKVARDKNIYMFTSPSLSYHCELVRRARDKLKQGVVPQFLSPVEPLSFYQWIRPEYRSNSSIQEVEVRVVLQSNVSKPIRVLEMHPPEGIELVGHWVSPRTEIGPFGLLPVMRFVVSKRAIESDSVQPHITYQVSGEETPRHALSVLPFEPRDSAGLFVPFVDQHKFLHKLDEYLAGARPGRTAHWLAIADGWGKGRSRALAECVRAAKQLGFEVLERAIYPARDESNQRDPIREAIAHKLGLAGGEDDVLRLVYWLEQGESHRHLDDTSIGLMAQYLHEGTELDTNLRAVTTNILQRACTQPILLAIDDLHNAPSVTGKLLRLLADSLSRIQEARLAVFVTYDPGRCAPELTLCFQDRIQLQDLDASDAIELAEGWFPELEYPPDCQESLVRFLGRRPLLIRQGLSCLDLAGHIRLEQGRWLLESHFDNDPDVKLRKSFDESEGLGMLLAEYEKLRQSEQRLIAKGLQIAAAIGVDFEYELWQQAMLDYEQCTIVQVRDVRDELTRREFIMSVSAEQGRRGTYRITPPILRRLIWQEIQDDPILASELHGLVARLLAQHAESDLETSGRIAYQLFWSQEESKMPEAFERFRDLALDSFRHHHLDSTIVLYERALDAAEKSRGNVAQDSMYQTWYGLAEALDARGRWQEAQDRASQLALNCENSGMYPLAAEARILAGWVCQELGDMKKAQYYYDRAGILVQAHTMPEIEARLLRKQAAWYAEQGLAEKAFECYEHALQLPQSAEDLAQAQGSYAENLRRCGRLDEAREYMELALRQCEVLTKSHAADLVMARVHIQAGTLSYTIGDLKKSRDHFERALGLAQSIGAVNEWAHAESWLGTVCSDMEHQRPSESTLEHYARAAELFELLGDKGELAKLVREYVPMLLVAGKNEAVILASERAAWLGVADDQIKKWRQAAEVALEQQVRKN